PQPECSVHAVPGLGPPTHVPTLRNPRMRSLPASNTHSRLAVGAGIRSTSAPPAWNTRFGTTMFVAVSVKSAWPNTREGAHPPGSGVAENLSTTSVVWLLKFTTSGRNATPESVGRTEYEPAGSPVNAKLPLASVVWTPVRVPESVTVTPGISPPPPTYGWPLNAVRPEIVIVPVTAR